MAGAAAADEREVLAFLEHPGQSPPVLHRSQEMAASLPIPDELTVEIFLRLPAPADLLRASAACASFRRVAADRTFLRRYRKLHAPPLLGFIEVRGEFHRASPPHPSASAASAVARAADFSFSFLPAPVREWIVLDIRDGRVLLYRSYFEIPGAACKLKEMVVCDPLHQEFLLLVENGHTFLVPHGGSSGDEEEAAEEIAFRVIWMARLGDKLVSLVFSSTIRQWQAGPSHCWVDCLSRSQYVYGCFYWVTDCRQKLLVLDTPRMEFSITDAPLEVKGSGNGDIAIVEAGEGRLGIFVRPRGSIDLSFIVRRNNAGSSGQWQLEKTISLGHTYGCDFTGSMGGQLFLQNTGKCFSLDVKTLQLETVSVRAFKGRLLWPRAYSNFPPSLLSSPTVASGVELETKETLEQGGAASSSA